MAANRTMKAMKAKKAAVARKLVAMKAMKAKKAEVTGSQPSAMKSVASKTLTVKKVLKCLNFSFYGLVA